MVEARRPERRLHRPVDPGTVPGQDRRGEGPVLPRHQPLDMRRGRHADAEGELPERPRIRPVGLDHRGPRIADRPEPLEEGEPPVVEPPRLRRRRRRREPRLPEEPQPRLQEVGGRRRVERDAHPRRGPLRLEPVDHHPVEEHPRPLARRPVETDHPALDIRRHLVREDRCRHHPRPQRRHLDPERRQERGEDRDTGPRPHPEERREPDAHRPGECRQHPALGLRRQREVERDAEREEDGNPERQVRTLRLDQRGETLSAHVPCSPARFRPKTVASAWLPRG